MCGGGGGLEKSKNLGGEADSVTLKTNKQTNTNSRVATLCR